MKLVLNNGEEYYGEFMKIVLAKWDNKRKEELTLNFDIGKQIINIPLTQIEKIINEDYFK